MAFNGLKYIKNVTKSFGYAVIDVVGEMNPVVRSFAETNEELGKELYGYVKDYKGTAKKIKTNILESDVYEFAKNYKKNLFDDLKTGKFYNKDRMDDIAVKTSGWDDASLEAEFADMFEDSDSDFDDWDKDSLRSDMFMATHIDDVGAKIANSNAEVTIRSAEYTANVQRETTKALYAQNNKLFGQALEGMAAINSNIGQLVGMPEIMQLHANNASTFFEKTSGQLDNVITLLDTLVKNTTPSSELEDRRRQEEGDLSYRDIFNYKGMPNIKKYVQYAKKNFMKEHSELALLGDMFGNGTSMLQNLAASPLEDVMKLAVRQTIPNMLKKSMEQFNDTLQGFFGSAITALNRKDTYDSPVLGFIKKIFGINPEMKTDIDTSAYEKGKVPWDGASRKALVEVIPGQLAKIISALTGEEPTVFNPESGKMESVGRLNDFANSRVQYSADSAGSDLRREIYRFMDRGKYKFKSRSDEEDWENDLDLFFRTAFENGGLGGEDISKHGLSSIGIKNASMLQDVLKELSRNHNGRAALLKLNQKILSERDNLTASMNSIEANGGIESVLHSGMFDEYLKFYNSDEQKRYRDLGIKAPLNGFGGLGTLSSQIDDKGNNLFFYLQEILKREDAIYLNSSTLVENGGGFGGSGSGGREGKAAQLSDVYSNIDKLKETADQKEKDENIRLDKFYQEEYDRFIEKNPDFASTIDRAITNNNIADTRDKLDGADEPKTLVDKLLAKKDIGGKIGVLVNGTSNFFNKPLEGIARMFDAADEKLFNLIYGENPSEELKNMGFIGVVKDNIQKSFDKMNTWIDEHILSPIKEKLGLREKGDLGRKIFGSKYDEFQEKMKQGIFGKKDEETNIRSGGLFGDYIQSVKDEGKRAWDWTKNGLKEVKDKIVGNGPGIFDKYSSSAVPFNKYASGGTVQKTGIAAVSEGELIIPSELNPFYHGKTDKNAQIAAENRAVNRFFGKFAGGVESVGYTDDSEIDDALINFTVENQINKICKTTGANKEKLVENIKKQLSQKFSTKKTRESRVAEYVSRAKAILAKRVSFADKMAAKKKIVEYDPENKTYKTADGKTGTYEKGQSVQDGRLIQQSAESPINDIAGTFSDGAKSIYKALRPSSGDKNADKAAETSFNAMVDDVKGNFKSYAGAMTVGGGIGAAASLLTGMVGGPLVGAAVGSAVGLAMKSDKVQNWLFGEMDENGDRQGGVFSKEMSKLVQEKVPSMAKWGLAGGLASIVLPGGPIAGTIVGATIGYAQKSEAFTNFMFNGVDDNGNRHRGLLNMTQDEFSKKVQKKVPGIGAGAIASLAMPLPLSLPAKLILGSAIGFASDTDKFKDMIFGKEDKDGERQGGLLGHFRDSIIKPFAAFMKEEAIGIKDWLQKDIMKPVTDSIAPITKQLGLIGKGLASIPKKLGDRFFNNTDFGRFLSGKLAGGAKRLGGNLARAGIGIAKSTIGLPFGMVGALGSRLRGGQIARGNADYMTSEERLKWREEHSVGSRFGQRMQDASDDISGGADMVTQRGKSIPGIGRIVKGIGKGAYALSGGLVDDLSAGAFRKLGGSDNFKSADEWMATASTDELNQLRSIMITAQNAERGTKTEINQAKKRIDGIMTPNLYGKLKQSDMDRIKKIAKDPKKSDEDVLNALNKAKTISGAPLDQNTITWLINNLKEPRTNLIRLASMKSDDDYKAAKKDAKAALGKDYKWAANLIYSKHGDKNAKKLESLLDYEIDMRGDDEPAIEDIKEEQDREENRLRHTELIDTLKKSANAMVKASNPAITPDQLPFPEAESGFREGVKQFTHFVATDKDGVPVDYVRDAENGNIERADRKPMDGDDTPEQTESDSTKPEGEEETDGEDGEEKDKGIISTLLDSFGVDGGIKSLLARITSPRLLTTIAGPVLLAAFIGGKFDGAISSLSQFIAGALGGQDAAMNVGLSGKDGEESYSGNALERVGKNLITGAGPNMVSDVFGFFGKRSGKLLEKYVGKYAKKRSIKNGVKVASTYGVNKVWGFLGDKAKKAENLISSGRDKLNGFFKGSADDIAEEGAEQASSGGWISKIKNLGKSNADDAAKAAANVAEEVADPNSQGSKSALKIVKEKITDFLSTIRKKTGKMAVDDKVIANAADGIADEAASVAKSGAKNAGKKTFIGSLKSMGPIGWAATLIFAVTDFTSGYNRASTILGVKYPTTGQCVISGLISAIKGVIEGIIACIPAAGTAISIALSLIPEKTFVTIFCETIGKALDPKLIEDRQKYTEEIDQYNKENGTNHDTEQYNATVRNEKGFWGSLVSDVKKLYSGKERKKVDSGLDKDGNLIAGYIDTNTARWKYWQAQINKGLDPEYAEAMYLNECLHDSQLTLTEERIADYKSRIAAYKSTAGAKEIPEITTDLHGLIATGKVSSFKSKAGVNLEKSMFGGTMSVFTKIFKKDDVDYGGSKSSGDYVGNYATGGLIKKSGLAALSKGEYRLNLKSILGNVFGSVDSESKDSSIFDKLTDMSSFIESLQSLDPSKSEWKDFWSKADADTLPGMFGSLQKALRKMVATIMMPQYAAGKVLEQVQGSMSSSIGVSSGSSGSSSSTGGEYTAEVKNPKKKSIFGKAIDAIKGIFGKGTGMYGGATGMDSGGFISQIGAAGNYGDSTYSEEGCAPATAAMMINTVNGNAGNTPMTIQQAGDYAVRKGYKVSGDGTREEYFNDIFRSNGIQSEKVNGSSAIYDNLKAGRPTILLGKDKSNKSKKKSPFGENPHYVLATGVDNKGNIIINDPEAKRGGKRYSRRILNSITSAISTKAAGGYSGLLHRYGGATDVASQVWYYLKQNGFTEQAAAGIMGNLKQETNMNPATEVKGVTCGIACWDFQNGKSALKEAAAKQGKNWTDLGFQLDYLLSTLPNAFKSYTGKKPHYYSSGEWCWWPKKMTLDDFKKLTSINEAAEIFERVYERASKPMMENRIKYANEYYKQFTGKEGEPVSYTGSVDTSSADGESSSGSKMGNALNKAFNAVLGGLYGEKLVNAFKSSGLINIDDDESGTSDMPSSSSATTTEGGTISDSASIGMDVVNDSRNYIGNKYVWGGNDLDNGIDCSGFVQQLYKKHGFEVYKGRANTKAMWADTSIGTKITGGTYKDLKAGDVMFFSDNGKDSGIHHVGIYDGNGHMIHAANKKPYSQGGGVRETDLSTSSYYQGQYIGAKRFGAGSGLNDVSTSQVLANTFKNSQTSKVNSTGFRNRLKSNDTGLGIIERLSTGSDGSKSMDTLIESVNRIVNLLQTLADNTAPIAEICKLITGMKEASDSNNTTPQKSMSVASKKPSGPLSTNSNDMLGLLTQLARI